MRLIREARFARASKRVSSIPCDSPDLLRRVAHWCLRELEEKAAVDDDRVAGRESDW